MTNCKEFIKNCRRKIHRYYLKGGPLRGEEGAVIFRVKTKIFQAFRYNISRLLSVAQGEKTSVHSLTDRTLVNLSRGAGSSPAARSKKQARGKNAHRNEKAF